MNFLRNTQSFDQASLLAEAKSVFLLLYDVYAASIHQPLSPEICSTREQPPRPNKKLFNKGCANLSGVSLAAASSKGLCPSVQFFCLSDGS